MNIQLAGCIILDEQEGIWLLHRNKKGITQWELPGGKVEPGEAAEQAAERELREELGVHVAIVRELGGDEFVEDETTFTYTWFLATIRSGQMTICEPQTFDDLQSFSLDELADLKLSGNMQKLHNALRAGTVTL